MLNKNNNIIYKKIDKVRKINTICNIDIAIGVLLVNQIILCVILPEGEWSKFIKSANIFIWAALWPISMIMSFLLLRKHGFLFKTKNKKLFFKQIIAYFCGLTYSFLLGLMKDTFLPNNPQPSSK